MGAWGGMTQRIGRVPVAAVMALAIGGCDGASPLPSTSGAASQPGASASASASLAPDLGRWTATGELLEGRPDHTATLLKDGTLLVAGGFDPTFGDVFGYVASAQLYHPETGLWSSTGAMNEGRSGHTATLLEDGRVLVAGGTAGAGLLASAELYDPASRTWVATGPMHAARVNHTATLLPNGQVLVAGLFAGGSEGISLSASAELFDPATDSWTPTASMGQARGRHTATPLPNGKVLVAGGTSEGTSGELYDPGTKTWTPTRPMVEGRGGHTATLLGNGQVLVVGSGGEAAQLYDPALDAWSLTGALGEGGLDNAATVLADGTVLVTGGYNSDGDGLAAAQAYDPLTGSWSAVAPMLEGRVYHTATLLPNGTVLVAGGSRTIYADSVDELLRSAELFDAGP